VAEFNDSAEQAYKVTDSGINHLKEKLISRGLPWSTVLSDSSIMIAINQKVTTTNQFIKKGDDVAFFPPVTGG
ncbi:MAG: MoaD/ThiS family protein, partial [Motiliproteus sp.]